MTSVLGRQKGKDTQNRKPREDGGRPEGGSPLHGMPGAKGTLKEAEEDSPQESWESAALWALEFGLGHQNHERIKFCYTELPCRCERVTAASGNTSRTRCLAPIFH